MANRNPRSFFSFKFDLIAGRPGCRARLFVLYDECCQAPPIGTKSVEIFYLRGSLDVMIREHTTLME